MMKGTTCLLLALLLTATLWTGCLSQEKGNLRSTLTASSADQEGGGTPPGTPPPGRLIANITLSEPPLLNRTVTATIGVYNPLQGPIGNIKIVLLLYRRTTPYTHDEDPTPLLEKVIWTGTLPSNGHAMVSGPLRVEEPGYYYARGRVLEVLPDGSVPRSTVVNLHLNVSENQTIVTPGLGPLEPEPPPPPTIPYVVKMDLDGVPALNRPVNLRVTIASLMDVRNTTFRVFLPEGFELVSGDLVWHGDLHKGISEGEIRGLGVALDKLPGTTLQRIPEDKKVQMRATIKAKRIGDARIFFFPSQELEPGVDCDLTGVYISRPGGAISYGGCLNVRVYNESYGLSSEQALPPEPRSLKPPPPPETPPPGMRWQDQWR